jgi:Na+-transporting NADH:ubiquinone oxidoreductase subunit C
MSERLKSIIFALVLCLVCSVLLTAASTTFKSAQEQNMRTDRRKNILKSAGLIDPGAAYSAEAIDQLYSERIAALAVDPSGTIIEKIEKNKDAQLPSSGGSLPMYLALDSQKEIEAYIIPIESRGLWGKIYGYMALQKDGSTIKGFTVYKHSETPGLGGEIENQWFQKNFTGKKIVDHDNQFVSVSITKGRAADSIAKESLPNYVDGISGATLTGQYLTKGLREVLSEYEPASVRFRQDILQCRMQNVAPWCKNEK